MKKKLNLIIVFVLMFCLSITNVDGACFNGDCTKIKGGVSGYAKKYNSTPVESTPCVSGGDQLCFGTANGLSGNGLYIKIVKYDSATKSEVVVGQPVLIYSGNFNSEFTAALNKVSDITGTSVPSSITDDEKAACISSKEVYEFRTEEVVKYGKPTYYIDGTTTGSVNAIPDSTLPKPEGFADYIKNNLKKYAGSPTLIKQNFFANGTISGYNDVIANMDNYYIVFESVRRYGYKGNAGDSFSVDFTEVDTSGQVNGTTTTIYEWTCSKSGVSNEWSASTPTSGCTVACDNSSGKPNCTKQGWTKTGKSREQTTSCSGAKKVVQTLYVQVYDGKSYIMPVRYSNSSSTSVTELLKAIVTPKDATGCDADDTDGVVNNCTRSVVYKNVDGENVELRDENGNIVYEYFVGPTLKKALVGTDPKYNKYLLYEDKGLDGNDINYKLTQGSNPTAVGVSFWWLPRIIGCNQVCSGNKSSDEFLSCAAQFCDNSIGYDDRANTQSLKACCMTDQCGYTYTPMTCENPVDESTKKPIANPYKGEDNYTTGDISSTCSIINIDEETKIKTEDSPRTITTCEAYDENKTIFDQKTYLIVACKESAAFQYADLSKTKIVAGEGLNYFANLYGGKECTVSFDIDSWKFAYASYHSEDQVCISGKIDDNGNCVGEVTSSRKLLENILNYYNKCSIGVAEDEETKKLCDIGGDAIGINMDGKPVETTWTSLGYNTNKVEVKTKVAEVIDNKEIELEKLPTYTLIENKNETDSSVVATSEKDAYSFAENKRKNFGKVKTYLSTSNVEVNYTFDKYCVTTDGKATIYKASSDGKCKQDSGVESKDVFGRNVYFTSLNATPSSEITINDTHAINTTEVVVKNKNEITYLTGSEYCPYKIEDVGLSCSIEIELMDSTTTHGSDIYDGKVKAILNVHNQLGTKDKIVSTEISYEACNGSAKKDANEIEISMCNSKNGVEIKDVNGSVTTKNGMTVECDKIIKLVNPCNNATACSVNKVSGEEKLYEIKTTYPGTAHYALTTDIKLHENLENPEKEGFKKILKSNGKNYVTVNEISENSRLYGMVTDSVGGKCVCWEDIYGVGDRDHFKCKTQCTDRTNEKAVKSFCNLHWHEDMDNYSSFSQCVEECKLGCPKELTCDIDQIKSYCDINHSKYNRSASGCVNYMYNECNCSGTDYVYRPINNSNPFPNSYESPIPGNREIGGNWVGKTEYITEDNNDSTSVTGANAGVSVEYEIHLTPSDIQKIRENTESYVSEGKDPYLDYIGVEQGKDGYCLEDGYCSEFINSSEFSTTIFKVK